MEIKHFGDIFLFSKLSAGKTYARKVFKKYNDYI